MPPALPRCRRSTWRSSASLRAISAARLAPASSCSRLASASVASASASRCCTAAKMLRQASRACASPNASATPIRLLSASWRAAAAASAAFCVASRPASSSCARSSPFSRRSATSSRCCSAASGLRRCSSATGRRGGMPPRTWAEIILSKSNSPSSTWSALPAPRRGCRPMATAVSAAVASNHADAAALPPSPPPPPPPPAAAAFQLPLAPLMIKVSSNGAAASSWRRCRRSCASASAFPLPLLRACRSAS